MTQNRRDLIKSSTAMTFLTVSNASTQAANRTVGIVHTTEISDQDMACFQARRSKGPVWRFTRTRRA
jgi:hypothetical protein